jgi:hypothetical protein
MQSGDALARLDKVLSLACRLTDPVVAILTLPKQALCSRCRFRPRQPLRGTSQCAVVSGQQRAESGRHDCRTG